MKRTLIFIQNLAYLLYRLAYQKWYLRRHLPSIQQRFGAENDGTLSPALLKKINYYAELMPVMVGDLFCLLRGSVMSNNERAMQTYLAIFTPIFDEWFDNQLFVKERVHQFLFQPNDFTPKNDFENLTLDVLKRLHALAPPNIDWTDIADKLNHAQANRQTDPSVTTAEIRRMTYEKGGYAFWLTRLFLNHPLSKEEEKAVMQFGFLIQYIDDIFDIREDRLDGTRTLASEVKNISDLKNDYEQESEKLFHYLKKTTFLVKHQKQFRRAIMVLFSMAFIAIRQLQIAQNKYGGTFNPEQLTRQELVCDMAKWKNWIWWARLYRFK
jgi:hypothetical protein